MSESNIIEVFESADVPVLTAVDVAERMEVSQQYAHTRLTELHQDEKLERKEVGAKAVVWWLPRLSNC